MSTQVSNASDEVKSDEGSQEGQVQPGPVNDGDAVTNLDKEVI